MNDKIIIKIFEEKYVIETAILITNMFIKYNWKDYFSKKWITDTLDYFDYKKYSSKELMENFWKSPIFYIALENEKVVWIIRWNLNKINSLFVDDMYFNKWIWKILVMKFEQEAIKQKSKYIEINSSIYAIKFYQKMWYKKISWLTDFMWLKVYKLKKILDN